MLLSYWAVEADS